MPYNEHMYLSAFRKHFINRVRLIWVLHEKLRAAFQYAYNTAMPVEYYIKHTAIALWSCRLKYNY